MKGLFPNVGAMVVWVAPNNVGVPPGILAACSGTLVHDRVFLTAGHCTRASEDGVPPFIRLFVTFNLHVLDDQSAWIPVVRQAWHPSTLPCHNNACNWPDPGIPPTYTLSDVGLILLDRPAEFIKPARLARPGTLDQGAGENQDQIIVGYGFADSTPDGQSLPISEWPGIRHYRVIPPVRPFDDRMAIGGVGENCFLDSGGPIFLGPLSASGNKSREIVAIVSAHPGKTCATGTNLVTRIDNENVQAWVDQQIQQFLDMEK